MSNYMCDLFLWVLQSRLIPSKVRSRLLALLGYEVDRSARIAHSVLFGWRQLTLEADVVVNVHSLLDANEHITIKHGTKLGPGVRIITGTHSYTNAEYRRGPGSYPINLPVVIAEGCWIGTGVTILPGVTIARGCVIAAGSVVTKSTQPNGLYCGLPAKRVRDLPVDDEAVLPWD